jgi:integrase
VAGLQERNGSFRILFRHQGTQHAFTLGRVSRAEAEAKASQVDYLLMRLKQNLVQLPPGTDLVTFLLFDGQPPAAAEPPRQAVTLGLLRDRYVATLSGGAVEENSLATIQMHLRHFVATLGEGFPVRQLAQPDLQRHINRRAAKKGSRGKRLSPVTLRKEMASFRAMWNWGVHATLVAESFPGRGLVYPKADEKPPFQTKEEIERKLRGLSARERAELWDCLFLTLPEIDELLAYVREHGAHPWIHPLFAFAAHTGARRSETIRVRVHDVDFDGGTVLLHEKKRTKGKRTTRRVPLSPALTTILQAWLSEHPGGPYLFCHAGEVFRSKKRSRTTGHQWGRGRATSLKGRMATVRTRESAAPGALTKDELHHHFGRTLAGSKWAVMRGWHVLRHSFASNCAAKGIDQRLIDAWLGHQTEEMKKRYRHLIPSTEQAAIRAVFG